MLAGRLEIFPFWYCLQHRRGAENSRITGGFFSVRLIFYI